MSGSLNLCHHQVIAPCSELTDVSSLKCTIHPIVGVPMPMYGRGTISGVRREKRRGGRGEKEKKKKKRKKSSFVLFL
jgi:hypothetical protein